MRTPSAVTTAVAGLVIVLSLAAGLSPARAEDRDARSGWGRSRTVAASQTIEGDYFAFGSLVTISGTVNGDVYAAGGQVLIEGRVNGDVIAAGGRVSISGSVAQDVRVAGGQVSLSGDIGRNVTVAGGTVELTRAAAVKGSLVAAGGSVHVAAPVGRSARAAAGSLIISSPIGQDVDAAAGALKITASAEVQGDVRYVSGAEAAVDPGARIRGRLSRTVPPELPRDAPETIAAFLLGGALVLVAVSFVSTLVLGLLSVRFLPRYHGSVVAILRERPWESLGVGFLAAVVTPVACLLLLASVVGAPLGLILAVLYAILLYWGRIFAAAWIGGVIFRLFRASPGPAWTFLLGLVAYYLLAVIPLLGWLVVALAVLFGLGAELIARKEFFLAARRQELL